MAPNYLHLSKKTAFLLMGLTFMVIIGLTFYITYLLAGQASKKTIELPKTYDVVRQTTQQIRKITFKNLSTQESIELWADGTINYFDKDGKLTRTRRRGFAETQSKFRDLERLINSNGYIHGYDGYQVIIETEQGSIIINPGGDGGENDPIDDIFDFVDDTNDPTPAPTTNPTALPSTNPTPYVTPTPDPSDPPTPTPIKPFECSDYYTSGKPIKISNTICGPDTNP